MTHVTAVPLQPIAKGSVARLWLGIAAGVLLAGGLAWAGTQSTIVRRGPAAQFMAWHKGKPGVITTATGLQYQVIKPGEGPSPTDGDIALINYKGTLRDGTVFDANKQVPMPIAGVVPGFAEGLKLMNRGATYRFWIPPALGYGDQSPDPKLPAGSVLIFDVDMIDFRSQAEIEAMRRMAGPQGQGGPAPQEQAAPAHP